MPKYPFHYWIKFDFNNIELITHNENGYCAAASPDRTIVIWHNQNIGPSLQEGQIVSIIVNQFSNIDQLQWIVNTDFLLIRDGDNISIWNIFTNQEEAAYLTTEPILFAKAISIGFLMVKISGKFSLYTRDREITSQITSDMILNVPNGVIIYPQIFRVVDDEWIEEELTMSWSERGLRRKLEGDNDIQLNGDLIHIGERDYELLEIPEGYRYLIDDAGPMIMVDFPQGLFLRTKFDGIIIQVDDGVTSVGVNTIKNEQLFVHTEHEYYVLRSDQDELRVIFKSSQMVREEYIRNINNHDNLLENLPPSFYFDFSQDIRYARYNQKFGFLWYPDYIEDFVFYDLFTQEGSVFKDVGRELHSYIQVNSSAQFLLEWNRGQQYPSGKLLLRNIKQPDQDPRILYDETIVSKRIDETQFLEATEDDVSYPLIIPEWEKIELWLTIDRPQESIEISRSQYFLMLERWSQSENAALLEYPEKYPKRRSFVLFGNLVLPMGSNEIKFENIAPEWTFHETTGLLALYSIDGYCYIINTFDPYLLPTYSFKSSLPYWLEFSPSGLYLVSLSFDIRKTNIKAHPQDKRFDNLTTEFPYITINVHNLGKQKSSKRSFRFPIMLKNDNVLVEFSNKDIKVFFPSYTDISEEVVIMYDFEGEKFHQVNGADDYRLWMTYSRHSPNSMIDNGDQFPIERHPEIKREYTMRPFSIFDAVLVRKEDDFPISMGDLSTTSIPQQSTLELYDLENTTELFLPFYYEERMKPIFIDTEGLSGINPRKLVSLERIDKLPLIETFNLDEVPNNKKLRKRMISFVKNQISLEIVHQETGIAYKHPEFKSYKDKISKELE